MRCVDSASKVHKHTTHHLGSGLSASLAHRPLALTLYSRAMIPSIAAVARSHIVGASPSASNVHASALASASVAHLHASEGGRW